MSTIHKRITETIERVIELKSGTGTLRAVQRRKELHGKVKIVLRDGSISIPSGIVKEVADLLEALMQEVNREED
jgi:hypothetical protein